MSAFIKDPDAVLDYRLDWSSWLVAVNDTIVNSTWIVPDGLAIEDQSNSTTTATIWLSGGTVDQEYAVTNRIVTAGGRTDDRSFTIAIRNR